MGNGAAPFGGAQSVSTGLLFDRKRSEKLERLKTVVPDFLGTLFLLHDLPKLGALLLDTSTLCLTPR